MPGKVIVLSWIIAAASGPADAARLRFAQIAFEQDAADMQIISCDRSDCLFDVEISISGRPAIYRGWASFVPGYARIALLPPPGGDVPALQIGPDTPLAVPVGFDGRGEAAVGIAEAPRGGPGIGVVHPTYRVVRPALGRLRVHVLLSER